MKKQDIIHKGIGLSRRDEREELNYWGSPKL